MRTFTRGHWYLDLLDDIKCIYRNTRDSIFYLFNKKKVNKILSENSLYVKQLKNTIHIENKMKLYHIVSLAVALSFYKQIDDPITIMIKAMLGEGNSIEKLRINI